MSSRAQRIGIALGLGLASAANPARAEDPCVRKGETPERERCGSARYASGRFAEAAAAFEGLWVDTGGVKYLLNAGLAREAAGSDAWARLHYLRYLESTGITERERDEVNERLAQLQARLVRVRLIVRPLKALGAGAVFRFERDTASGLDDFSVPLAMLVHPDGLAVELDRGLWSVRVDPVSPSPAYNTARDAPKIFKVVSEGVPTIIELRPETAEIAVTIAPPEEVRRGVDLQLIDPHQIEPTILLRVRGTGQGLALRTGNWLYKAKQRRMSPWTLAGRLKVEPGAVLPLVWSPTEENIAPRVRQRKVMEGLGGGGAGLALLGAVLLGVGLSREDAAQSSVLDMESVEAGPVKVAQNLSAWGGGLLGGGLGLAISAGLEAMEPSRTRLALTFATGGGVGAVGVIWHVAAYLSYRSEAEATEAPPGSVPLALTQGKGALGAASAGLLGLGVSVVMGAAIARLTRIERFQSGRLRAAVGVGPTGPGLIMRGRF